MKQKTKQKPKTITNESSIWNRYQDKKQKLNKNQIKTKVTPKQHQILNKTPDQDQDLNYDVDKNQNQRIPEAAPEFRPTVKPRTTKI